MQRIPFPPTLVRISATAAHDRIAQAQKDARRKSFVMKDHESDNVAVIRGINGKIRPAYDVYAPEHLPGEEPGLGRVSYKVRHYPNDTSGYESEVVSFESIAELESRGIAVDRTAAAMVVLEGGDPDTRRHLIVASNEEELAEALRSVPETAKIIRSTITTAGDAPLLEFAATSAAGGQEIHAASSIGDLAGMLRKRYGFLEEYGQKPLDDAGVISRLIEHGEDKGWDVAIGSSDLGPERLMNAIAERDASDPSP